MTEAKTATIRAPNLKSPTFSTTSTLRVSKAQSVEQRHLPQRFNISELRIRPLAGEQIGNEFTPRGRTRDRQETWPSQVT
jgi:hypothetical protein